MNRLHNDVLILSRDAASYGSLLGGLASEGVDITLATTATEGVDQYRGQAVLLAEPDTAASVFNQFPKVRWVQSTWAGVRPLLAVSRTDFILTGVKDVFGAQMAEYVLGHLLARELRITERDQHQRDHRWNRSQSGTLQGKTLGILGTGSIGRHIAATAAAFGLRCLGLNRGGRAVDGFQQVFEADQLHEFLAQCDYLVSVLPETPETSGLLGTAAFRACKNTAWLVNIGRGNVMDEGALAKALHDGVLGGAILDVFREEPLSPASPLWSAPNTVITGHVAGVSRPQDVAEIFLENYRRYCAGEALQYVVDLEKGY